jgi:small subunit ribosomal protein S1
MSKTQAFKKAEYVSDEIFADLFKDSIQAEKLEGNVVKGEVIAIETDLAVIDVGLKSEGRIPLKEFADINGKVDIKVGDKVEVYLERAEGMNGQASISREKALRQLAWENLEKNHNDGDTVEGVIFGRVKGGFTVDINGVIAFLPGSQVDIRPVKDITPLMNIKQPFQILKMDKKQGNVVVSRRAILEESREEERDAMLSKIKEGVTLDGFVKNITDYGAFIDLGSVDGLLHVTDISWSRIGHPSEVLTLGQKIKVKVIKFNEETKRISLGVKQLEGNPWHGIAAKFPKGSKSKGNVTNITDYGAFVEIESGIEGLVHVSEISWTKQNAHPSKLLSVGQEVEVMILDIDEDKHRISLGMKQCSDNPWAEFANRHPAGSVLEGEVKNTVDFGIFIGFDGSVDGLVHVSDVSWSDTPEVDVKNFKPGQKVQVKVLSVEPEKERISLGIKQLLDDPKAKAYDGIAKGAIVTCVISKVTDDGIEVSVDGGISSFIKRNELARDRVDQRIDRFAVGDKVDAKVTNVDKAKGSVTLSIKAMEVDEQKEAIATYGSTDSGASLGDILGAALSSSSESKNKKKKDQ